MALFSLFFFLIFYLLPSAVLFLFGLCFLYLQHQQHKKTFPQFFCNYLNLTVEIKSFFFFTLYGSLIKIQRSMAWRKFKRLSGPNPWLRGSLLPWPWLHYHTKTPFLFLAGHSSVLVTMLVKRFLVCSSFFQKHSFIKCDVVSQYLCGTHHISCVCWW